MFTKVQHTQNKLNMLSRPEVKGFYILFYDLKKGFGLKNFPLLKIIFNQLIKNKELYKICFKFIFFQISKVNDNKE